MSRVLDFSSSLKVFKLIYPNKYVEPRRIFYRKTPSREQSKTKYNSNAANFNRLKLSEKILSCKSDIKLLSIKIYLLTQFICFDFCLFVKIFSSKHKFQQTERMSKIFFFNI